MVFSYCQHSFPAQPRSLLPLAVLTVVLCAPLSTAAVDFYAPGKDDRPPGRIDDYSRQSFPCDDPIQDLTLSPSSLHVFTDTTSGQGAVNNYGCQPGWPETGPEHLYILTADGDLILDVWLADNVPDHDLVLLSACHTDSCLVQANSELSAVLRAGRTYYLMVDGYQGAAGTYTLTLETRYLGLAPMICEPDNGIAVAIDLRESVPDVLEDTLHGAPNLISIYDCSQLTWPGGEAWYALTLAAADTAATQNGFGSHMRVDITASTGTLDLALWLFDGCGPEAVCLAFADQGNAGQNETLSWRNLEPEPVTV